MSDILYNDLIRFYHPDLFRYDCCGGVISIYEQESNATVRMVEMCYHGKLLTIKNDLLKACHKIYKNNESNSPELMHDCDGIFFLTNREQKYFVLIELKSKYTSDNLVKAERQLAASYIRVLSRLSCLTDFDPYKYKACGIIVSHEPSTAELLKVIKKRQTKQTLDRYENQMMAFCKGDFFNLNHLFVRIHELPVRQDLLFDVLPVFHINCPGTSVKFELDSVLKKL